MTLDTIAAVTCPFNTLTSYMALYIMSDRGDQISTKEKLIKTLKTQNNDTNIRSGQVTNKHDLDYYLNLTYPFTVRPDYKDGGYIVEFPDLRYCAGTGDTIEEAINDALLAKSEWIKASYEAGISIPEPTSGDEYNGRITLRIPRSLHRMVIETARKEGVSANQFLSHLISMGVAKKPF